MNKVEELAAQVDKMRFDATFSDDFTDDQLRAGGLDFLQAMSFLSLAHLSLMKAASAYVGKKTEGELSGE